MLDAIQVVAVVSPTQVAQYVVNGIVFGGILALGAIGLSLVYGILSLSNFAHGDFLTFGALMAVLFGTGAFLLGDLTAIAVVAGGLLAAGALVDRWRFRRLEPHETWTLVGFGAALVAAGLLFGPGAQRSTVGVLVVASLLAILATVVLTVGLEFAVWRPLRRRHATLLTLVITSIGVSLVVRNGLQQYFGGGNLSFDRPTTVAERFFGIALADEKQFAIATALVLIGLVHVFLKYTRTGKAMRALADNFDLARVTGIDVERIVVHVWVIAGALIAVAGILLTLATNNTINVNTGFFLIIPLFASVILGGIGSPYGAMLGGFIVGIAMETSPLWIQSQYRLAAAFIILILVLMTRPQGLLGRKA